MKLLLPGLAGLSLVILVLAMAGWAAEIDPLEEAAARERIKVTIESASRLPKNEEIEALGQAVQFLPQKNSCPDQEAAKPLYEEALCQLTSIPGHAEYFGEKLRRQRQLLMEGGKSWNDWNKYRLLQSRVFGTLGAIPSAESVKVLSSFLNDDKGSAGDLFPDQPQQSDRPPGTTTNAYLAVKALGGLALEGAVQNSELVNAASTYDGVPVPEQRWHYVNMEVDRPRWVQWWEEVQAGKVTYRFAGSPIEYGPDGPVVAAVPTRSAPVRMSPAANGGESGRTFSSTWGKVAAAIGALLVLLGTWRFLLRRKSVR